VSELSLLRHRPADRAVPTVASVIPTKEGIVMSRRVAFAALLTLVAWSQLAVPAHSRTGRHCAYRLVTVERHGNVNVADPVLIGCYTTFAEAVSAGTGSRVELSAAMTPQALSDADLAQATASDWVLIGIEYYGTNLGGISRSYSAPSTCSSTASWEVNYVGDDDNDRFSSGKGYGGCDHNRKFQDADFGGNALTCTPTCQNYGTLSDEVSSLRWRP
jgi:hypothetical protein